MVKFISKIVKKLLPYHRCTVYCRELTFFKSEYVSHLERATDVIDLERRMRYYQHF